MMPMLLCCSLCAALDFNAALLVRILARLRSAPLQCLTPLLLCCTEHHLCAWVMSRLKTLHSGATVAGWVTSYSLVADPLM